MEIGYDRPKLLDMVERAREGKIVLPEFQRSFVWRRDGITDLLVSILKGYFIGSFLMLRTDVDSNPFAIRAIQGVNKQSADLAPELMVLDGQQRLTSLHYVLAAPPDIPLRGTKSSYRFFLDLRKVAEDNIDDAITSERSDRCAEMLEREYQFQELVIPFTEVESWDDWQDAYEDWLIGRDRDEYFEYRDHERRVWNKVLRSLQETSVPTMSIPRIPPNDPDRVGEVCAIFEKMNSTGEALSVFDLLTARLYKDRVFLRDLWEEAVTEHDHLRDFSGGNSEQYGIFMLRTMALLRGTEVRSKALINLSPENFEKDWRTAARYTDEALKRMRSTNPDGFGAFDKRWVPYSTMVSTLAALLRYIDEHRMGHQSYKYVRKWYWGSVFLERYAGAVEAVIGRDYRDLVALFNDETRTPSVFAEVDNGILSRGGFPLLGVSRINAVYRGVINLVAIRGAKDFRADDSIEFHELDDHHVFPQAYLRALKNGEGRNRYTKDEINSVVNRTLISSDTNRKISKTAPSVYVEQIVPEERKAEIMGSHYIDAEALHDMEADDYDAFLLRREDLLSTEIIAQLQT